jgi:membrane protein implicated in regulation of membrane protease activity
MYDEQEPNLHHWERKLLIVAFGAWAGVVAYMGNQVVNRVDQVVTEMRRQSDLNSEAHQLLDRRLTIVEQRQEGVLRALTRIDNHIETELHTGERP